MRADLCQKELCEMLGYCPATGILTWKPRPMKDFRSYKAWVTRNSRMEGKEAGSKQYDPKSKLPRSIGVFVNGYVRKASHVVLAMHGVIVESGQVVDHINGNPFDNRLENLRVCEQAQNTRNRKIPSTNRSGYMGVSFDSNVGKWSSSAAAKRIGYFQCPTSAAIAYDKWVIKNFGAFARPNILPNPHLSNR